jgi:hypothetical protein
VRPRPSLSCSVALRCRSLAARPPVVPLTLILRASSRCCLMPLLRGGYRSVALWSHVRKKPIHVVRGAHGAYRPTLDQQAAAASTTAGKAHPGGAAEGDEKEGGVRDPTGGAAEGGPEAGPAGVGGAAAGWVGAVAVCRGSDLAASGAGDGAVRLWALHDGNKRLRPLHTLPTVSARLSRGAQTRRHSLDWHRKGGGPCPLDEPAGWCMRKGAEEQRRRGCAGGGLSTRRTLNFSPQRSAFCPSLDS